MKKTPIKPGTIIIDRGGHCLLVINDQQLFVVTQNSSWLQESQLAIEIFYHDKLVSSP